MCEVIDYFESKYLQLNNDARQNFFSIGIILEQTINDFIGNDQDYYEYIDYYNQYGFSPKLADLIKDKKGLCAEKSALSHQILTLLNESDYPFVYKSTFLKTELSVEDQSEYHALILLEHQDKELNKNSLLYDVINPLDVQFQDGNIYSCPAIYELNQEETEKIKEKSAIVPNPLYVKNGFEVLDKKRIYGKKIQKNKVVFQR